MAGKPNPFWARLRWWLHPRNGWRHHQYLVAKTGCVISRPPITWFRYWWWRLECRWKYGPSGLVSCIKACKLRAGRSK